MNTPEQAIAAALYDHQGWRHDGAPDDECNCCAREIIDALWRAGYTITATPITSGSGTTYDGSGVSR